LLSLTPQVRNIATAKPSSRTENHSFFSARGLCTARAITTYQKYLKQRGSDADAETELLEFLCWSDSSDGDFGSDVRIVLAAGDFSKEVTSAVLWLKSKDVDISCVRIKPYKDDRRILLDVQTIIPLPEALDYQVGIERKKKAQEVKRGKRDTRKFDITIGSEVHSRLSRQRAMLLIISTLCARGKSPEEINKQITWRKELFCKVHGDVSSAQFVELAKQSGKSFGEIHYFCDHNELIRHGGDTYALTRKWGPKTTHAMEKLINRFASDGSIGYQLCGAEARQ